MYKHKGVGRPQGHPYTLSIAVDQLLKAEFDEYRERGEMHPSLVGYDGLAEAKLFSDHVQLQKWRNNFEGLKYHDEELDATLFGAVDDMLEFADGSLAVIDYKSSGAKEISIYDDYQMQMDVYTHILEKAGYKTARKACSFLSGGQNQRFPWCLPFRGQIRHVDADPTYIHDLCQGCQPCRSTPRHKHTPNTNIALGRTSPEFSELPRGKPRGINRLRLIPPQRVFLLASLRTKCK